MWKFIVLAILFATISAAPPNRAKRGFHNGHHSFADHHPNAFTNFAGTFSNANTHSVNSHDHFAAKSSGLTNSYSGATAQTSSHNLGGQTFTGSAANSQASTIGVSSGNPYEGPHRHNIASSSAQTGVLGHGGFGYGASANVLAQTGPAAGYNFGGASSFTGGYGGAHGQHSGAIANAAAQSAVVGGAGEHGGGVSAAAQTGTFGGGHGYSGSVANAAVSSGNFEYGNRGGNYRNVGRGHGASHPGKYNRFDDSGRDSFVDAANVHAAHGSFGGSNGGTYLDQNTFVGQAEPQRTNYGSSNGFNGHSSNNYHNVNAEFPTFNSGNHGYKTEHQQSETNGKQDSHLGSSNVHQRFQPATTFTPKQHFLCNNHRLHPSIDGLKAEEQKFNSYLINAMQKVKTVNEENNIRGAESTQEVSANRNENHKTEASQGTYKMHENVLQFSENKENFTNTNVSKAAEDNSGIHGEEHSGFHNEEKDVVKSESAGNQKQRATLGQDHLFAHFFNNQGISEDFGKPEKEQVHNAHHEQTSGAVNKKQIGSVGFPGFDHQIGIAANTAILGEHIAAANSGKQTLHKREQALANGASLAAYIDEHNQHFANNRQPAPITVSQFEDFGKHGIAEKNSYQQNLANSATGIFGVNSAVANSATFNNQGLTGGNSVVHTNNLGQSAGAASSLLHLSDSNYHGQNVATHTGHFGEAITNAAAVSGSFGHNQGSSVSNQHLYGHQDGTNSRFLDHGYVRH